MFDILNIMPKLRSGQVILGLIISLGILSILSGVVLTLVTSAYRIISFTSARTRAKYLATETLETIRNLPYNDVGTVSGIPPGTIPQQQTAQVNGQNYEIVTRITYVDDPFDTVAPADTVPNDYKLVRVEVGWGGIAPDKGVVLYTNIAPKGAEVTTGGGTLSILVFDSLGEPVGQADVHITSSISSPAVDANYVTGDNGRLILPGYPACNSCYRITVTKDGYSEDRTYSTSEVTNPTKPDSTVLEEQLTEISFAIDQLSNLSISSTTGSESNFSILPNQSFILRGSKTIGTNALDEPVYKYEETLSTGASGTVEVNDIEWDSYEFLPQDASYDVSGAYPLTPIVVNAGTTINFKYSSVAHTNNTLHAIFLDPNSSPIASVSALLLQGASPVASSSSGLASNPDFGQIFFEDLDPANYVLQATASGFLDYNNTVSISGQNSEQIILTPQ